MKSWGDRLSERGTSGSLFDFKYLFFVINYSVPICQDLPSSRKRKPKTKAGGKGKTKGKVAASKKTAPTDDSNDGYVLIVVFLIFWRSFVHSYIRSFKVTPNADNNSCPLPAQYNILFNKHP